MFCGTGTCLLHGTNIWNNWTIEILRKGLKIVSVIFYPSSHIFTISILQSKILTTWDRFVRSVFLIPQRYVLGIMGLLAVCNAYTMRVCLNLAVTQMVNNTKTEGEQHFDPYACPDDDEIFTNGTVSTRPVSGFVIMIFLKKSLLIL